MYQFFSPMQITPAGWLKTQLRLQADGLAGNLDKMWPDVKDSAWIGGNREGWERVPYWLDGFLPLAYLLRDEDMIARAEKYIVSILDRQCTDGWICPCSEAERPGYDAWSFLLIGKVLAMYCEFVRDIPEKKNLWKRADKGLYKAMECLYRLMADSTIKLFSWGKFRWFEGLIPLQYLQSRYKKDWIPALAKLLREQGADWNSFRDTWERPINEWTFHTHIVNIGMMFKYEAAWCALTGEEYTDIAEDLWQFLEARHGTAAGCFTGDECLSGTYNNQGTELCSVNELMYSCELLYSITGRSIWADRLEKLTFNALPATISDDMWTHQYDQQVNQISCERLPGRSIFRTNGSEAHLFGLEPNYGCCTANMGQAWPKFVLSAFRKTRTGIECPMMVPVRLDTKIHGKTVSLCIDTEYPFRHAGVYTVTAPEAVKFTLKIRVPGWAKGCTVNGEKFGGKMIVFSREWVGTTEIRVEFFDAPRMVSRPRKLKAVEYGPLLFALPIEAEWTMREYEAGGVERKFPWCDYELSPLSEWRYGFASADFTIVNAPVSDVPFSAAAPAVKLCTRLVPVAWDYADGFRNIAAPAPVSDKAAGDAVDLTLITYGAAKLRMTEMPMVKMPK
ncbi:MAG: glycoside hydrolase family 127 protein [Clostridia bacterium]|nr:glycoside hydrolase family 127 protein [Clostridia bacterium]